MPIYALEEIKPEIAEDVFIAPGAHIIGNVKIHAGASVWFGAVLRGDTELIEIGAGANIQDGAILHADPGYPLKIGANVTIGHNCIMHGCSIGDGSLIGMGSIIMNGAVIGAHSLVGAQALIPEGKQFEAGAMIIGSPGRAMRSLTQDQQNALMVSGKYYEQNAARFAKGLKGLSNDQS